MKKRPTKREKTSAGVEADLKARISEWNAILPEIGSPRLRQMFVEALASAQMVRGADYAERVSDALLATLEGIGTSGRELRAALPANAHQALDAFAAHCTEFGRVAAGVAAEAKFVPGLAIAQEATARQAAGAEGARRRGERVRNIARAYITANPDTSLSACAKHVAAIMDRDPRDVRRTIADLFELVGGGPGQRPKRG